TADTALSRFLRDHRIAKERNSSERIPTPQGGCKEIIVALQVTLHSPPIDVLQRRTIKASPERLQSKVHRTNSL
ncbi:hypothetical protein, partial [Caballeronia zhejiangensis]|uniref:hypothetical protein n=1 Tax=Caballeronia zhejiangensis TaxID=871203 RepID=UPI0019D3F2CC